MEEIFETIEDLFNSGVQFLTVGQYLQPSFDHLPVKKFYTTDEFSQIKQFAEKIGFEKIFCNPLVRSSFHADEMI
jgi:lipoic acid synthetase